MTFTLDTTDRYGAPIQQTRYYYVTRPDGLPKSKPAHMILVFAAVGNSGADGLFRDVAAKAGLLVISCAFTGNSDGGSWVNDNSVFAGNDDYDYVAEVIRRVRESENGTDAFVAGLSKGGHMALAYACERPSTIKAAASIDEFMQETNYPTAPVPILMFHGTADANVAYTMAKDTLDGNRDIAGDSADPDHDGCTNRQEFAGGSDPLDASSVPTIPAFRRGHSGCPRRVGR